MQAGTETERPTLHVTNREGTDKNAYIQKYIHTGRQPRQTYRQAHIQTGTYSHKQKPRAIKTDREKGRHRLRGRLTGRQSDWYTYIHTHVQTGQRSDSQTDSQTGKHTNIQTGSPTGIQTHKTQTEKHTNSQPARQAEIQTVRQRQSGTDRLMVRL